MDEKKQEKTPEQRGDEFFEEGKYREAADAYGECLKSFRGYSHLTRIAIKQTKAMRELFKQEPFPVKAPKP